MKHDLSVENAPRCDLVFLGQQPKKLNNSLCKRAAMKLLLIVGVYLSHLLLLGGERKRKRGVLLDLSVPHSAVERCE